MASASAATPSTITVVGSSIGSKSRNNRKGHRVKFITGLNAYNGLKAQNCTVTSLGVPVSSQQAFAKVVSSISMGGRRSGRGGGGAASSTCNAAGEIFQIAAIMNGLTLVGVAVGFVLLRIEAFVEESE
ncbi:uncharacterized protein LOC131634817 [Vicia villosa]|uniref:uncharacterized protein LOC131634817 n=1 Tax=Vicia villosa TaxID=3911 RepID=UPI00273CB8AD|nr:uncharacterized protein LOC131634817 [Vicia villosa]